MCTQTQANSAARGADGQNQHGPMPAITFEFFSAQVEQLVKDAYSAAGLTEQQRADTEREMFTRATVPEVLVPAILKLLTDVWPRFIAQPSVDLGRIVKHDIAWLDFTEDKFTRAWHATKVVDVVRKTPLPPGAKVRRCVRCNAAIEDIYPESKWPGWVLSSMKNCICLGNWGEVQGKPGQGSGRGSG